LQNVNGGGRMGDRGIDGMIN